MSVRTDKSFTYLNFCATKCDDEVERTENTAPDAKHPRALDLNQIYYCIGRGASRKRLGESERCV